MHLVKRDAEESDSKGSTQSLMHLKIGRKMGNKNNSNNNDCFESSEKRFKKEKEASNSSISLNLSKVYNNYYKSKKLKVYNFIIN